MSSHATARLSETRSQGPGQDQSPAQLSGAGTATASDSASETEAATVTVLKSNQYIEWNSLQVIARTSPKDCKAVVALPRCTERPEKIVSRFLQVTVANHGPCV